MLAYAKPYRVIFILGALATLVSSGLNLVFPLLFGRLIDASFLKVGSTDTGPLDHTVLLLLGIFAQPAEQAEIGMPWRAGHRVPGAVERLQIRIFLPDSKERAEGVPLTWSGLPKDLTQQAVSRG